MPAEALHCNTSYLTAVANDYSFDLIYARLIKGLGKKGDVLVGLSTSGNSANIVNAFETAKEKEMITKALNRNNGKRKYAAQALGISERTLYRKIKQYDL